MVIKFFLLALLLLPRAKALDFVKLELSGGEECKIDLRENPTENNLDPFPETKFCHMREVLLFEEIFLGHVRVANAGMARPVLRLATEGSLHGAIIGGVIGCFASDLNFNLKLVFQDGGYRYEAQGEWFNRLFTSVVSAFAALTFVEPEPSKIIPLVEKIAPREEALNLSRKKVVRFFFKPVPAAFVGYESANWAFDLCGEEEDDDILLLTAGIIDYRLQSQD